MSVEQSLFAVCITRSFSCSVGKHLGLEMDVWRVLQKSPEKMELKDKLIWVQEILLKSMPIFFYLNDSFSMKVLYRCHFFTLKSIYLLADIKSAFYSIFYKLLEVTSYCLASIR